MYTKCNESSKKVNMSQNISKCSERLYYSKGYMTKDFNSELYLFFLIITLKFMYALIHLSEYTSKSLTINQSNNQKPNRNFH